MTSFAVLIQHTTVTNGQAGRHRTMLNYLAYAVVTTTVRLRFDGRRTTAAGRLFRLLTNGMVWYTRV